MISCFGIILLIVLSLIRHVRFRRNRKAAAVPDEKNKEDLSAEIETVDINVSEDSDMIIEE